MPQWHTFYSNFLFILKMIYDQFVVDLGGETYICYRLYARAGEMKADERCWFGGSFERALANFVNFAIFKSNYLSYFTQTLDCNLNLLYVYLY